MEEKRKAAYREIIFVAIALAVITIVEFILAGLTDGSATLMFILALAKTGLIVNFFMHIYRLWREEEH
jgi:cytochrome c oxidase subunit IV